MSDIPINTPVLYSVYPFKTKEGGFFFNGLIVMHEDRKVIRTHPRHLEEGGGLEGMASHCELHNALDIIIDVKPIEPHDSRSYGGIFCSKCNDVELDDEHVALGYLTCHDCEVLS